MKLNQPKEWYQRSAEIEGETEVGAGASPLEVCSPVVAFDIDGTWSLNPSAWLTVFEFLESQGFRCIIVTGAAHPQEKLVRLGIPSDAPLIVSGSLLKEAAARQAGYTVAIWIDDMPGMIQDCRILAGDLDDSPESDRLRRNGKIRDALLDAEFALNLAMPMARQKGIATSNSSIPKALAAVRAALPETLG